MANETVGPKVVAELEDVGYCSSCDELREFATFQNSRPCCVVCGDFLVFAEDDAEMEG